MELHWLCCRLWRRSALPFPQLGYQTEQQTSRPAGTTTGRVI